MKDSPIVELRRLLVISVKAKTNVINWDQTRIWGEAQFFRDGVLTKCESDPNAGPTAPPLSFAVGPQMVE